MESEITTNVEDLDGAEGLSAAANVDLSLLKQAADYNVDLDSLESPINQNVQVEIPQQQQARVKEHFFWQDMDVNLSDIVNLVMNTSERPIIMVSDDKAVYFNYTAMQMLDIKNMRAVIDEPFLSFVDKEDWNVLTSNIGEMLTAAKKQPIKLRSLKGKVVPVEFQAIYLPDSKRFSFILVGGHANKASKPFFNNLYDDLTGLPNFFLFEDRVQMAVNNENYKDSRLPKDLIVVASVSIDNIEMFRKLHLEEFALKKIANTLVLSLRKNYTVAKGLKYQFWILMPDIANNYDLDTELKKLMAVFKEGVSDNFTTHELSVSVGVSVFPAPARSAKKLIEQAIDAVKEAQNTSESSMVLAKR